MEEELIEFIKNEFISDNEIEIEPETKLITSGIIDSFSLVSLQSFIERKYGKRIPNPRMTAENCDTIQQLIELIIQF